jgi:hypothetical protein
MEEKCDVLNTESKLKLLPELKLLELILYLRTMFSHKEVL